MYVDSSVMENAREGSALELSMQGHCQRGGRTGGMLHADMATALACNRPSCAFQRLDETLTRNDRKSSAHAGTGNLRRITPASSGRPSSRSPSAYSASASCALVL